MIERRSATAGPLAPDSFEALSFWQGQALFLAVLVPFGLIVRTIIYDSFETAAILGAVLDPAAALFTAFMWRFYRRLGDAEAMRQGNVALAVQLSLLGAVLLVLAAGTTRILLALPMPQHPFMQWVALPFGYYLFIFLSWSFLYLWISASIASRRNRERATAAENAALRAGLEQLRLQLDPHFLFNALNGVAVEIPDRPEVALGMLHDVADYLRSSLRLPHRTVCLVEEEVATLHTYLAIQQARSGERLRCELRIDEATLQRPVPNFVLQLLVENAIKHGLRGSGGSRLDLLVRVEAEGADLRVEVRNTGRLEAPARPAGVGLYNLRRRLDIDYPGRHEFRLAQDGDGVLAELSLRGAPCHA